MLVPEVHKVVGGSFKTREPPEIKATGYVVDTLEAALWGFHKTDSFKDGCLLVSNLGDDSDTVAAVYGQIAGAFYGMAGIPEVWRSKIFYRSLIEVLSEEIYLLSDRTKGMECPNDSSWVEFDVKSNVGKMSSKYRSVKMEGFQFLEEKSRELVRRLKPCPKQFKSLAEVDSAISEIVSEYLKIEMCCPSILEDFKAMWMFEKEKLALRLGKK